MAFDFIKNEHDILKLWAEKDAFSQMRDKNKASKNVYRTLDGPATANCPLCVHHAFGRTLKDSFIKYNTLKGRRTHFQNGFDAQGMWVEVEVEKHLGLRDKKAITEYGLGKFTEFCMERVNSYAKVQTDQSIRLGQIMDWDNSYFTNSDKNIECIWNFLRVCNERGMIVRSYKAMPWCPRCGTSLSEHEMSGQYKEQKHKAVIVKVKVENGEYINIWTTTPWTLPANVAIAVNPKDTRWAHLIGKTYEPIFSDLKVQNFEHKIIPWEDVSLEEGTGAVHIATGCGAEDFALGLKHNLKQIIPVDEAGVFTKDFEYLAGLTTANCADVIFEHLKKLDKIVKIHDHTHNYPFCWRCKTDVIFRLVEGWDIKTDGIRAELIKAAETVHWSPDYLLSAMRDWLTNMGDWNISRRRFYGLPLPIYPCECGHFHVVGSRDELKKLAVKPELVDKLPHLHRPYIDEVEIKCPKCGKVAKRIPDVGDCWLDAGIAPFSTRAVDYKPFDAVTEMKEQVRLWFYSQLFMSVVLEKRAPYLRVNGYAMVVGENGEKLSKTGNNSLKLEDACEKFGADAIRYVYAGSNSSNDMRFGGGLVEEARKKLIAFYNAFTFYATYADIDKPDVFNHAPKNLDVTDEWLIAATDNYVRECDAAYEDFKPHTVVALTEAFVEDLSNFYIRINRKRFWKNADDTDKANAYWTLYNAIRAVTIVMTPITPFMCEHIWQKIRGVNDAELVVAGDFPRAGKANKTDICERVKFVKRIISLAYSLRSRENLKLRQPLKTLYVITKNTDAVGAFTGVLRDEVNVKNIECTPTSDKFNTPYLTVNFKTAGAVLKARVQELKNTLTGLSDADMAKAVDAYKKGKVSVGGFKNLSADIFIVMQKPRKEFVSIIDGDISVVLDTTIDENLRDECFVRELIRAVQDARKTADLEITARIALSVTSPDKKATAIIEKFRDKIMGEVLSTKWNADGKKSTAKVHTSKQEIEGYKIEIKFELA